MEDSKENLRIDTSVPTDTERKPIQVATEPIYTPEGKRNTNTKTILPFLVALGFVGMPYIVGHEIALVIMGILGLVFLAAVIDVLLKK